jgi:II/X family phage/plasmid replication protein
MIDWVTVELPCIHVPIDSGHICKILPGGVIDWQSPCRYSVEGSYSASISVKSVGGDGRGRGTHILLSGNPSKFLQGHNVFGSEDLLSLVYDVFTVVCNSLSIEPAQSDLKAVKEGNYVIKNIDICRSFELPTRGDGLAWLRAMEYKSKTRHGRPSTKGGTLYFGLGTSRWKVKAYSKGEELESRKKGHQLPPELVNTPIKAHADNLLRIEITLLSKELREIGIDKAVDLNVTRIDELYGQYIGRIEMNEQIRLSSQAQMNLPTKLQSTYLHWNNGEDLRALLPKPTFYRHRKGLLEYGIDIALRKEVADRSNVIPLIRVLEAVPVGIPEWAFDRGLVHSSAVRGVARLAS